MAVHRPDRHVHCFARCHLHYPIVLARHGRRTRGLPKTSGWLAQKEGHQDSHWFHQSTEMYVKHRFVSGMALIRCCQSSVDGLSHSPISHRINEIRLDSARFPCWRATSGESTARLHGVCMRANVNFRESESVTRTAAKVSPSLDNMQTVR